MRFQGLPRFRGLHPRCPGSAPPCPLRSPAWVNITTRQSSRNATDRAFARPTFLHFVSGLHRRDFARRCRSATRQLGLYRDRTLTGKPVQAYLDTRRVGCGRTGTRIYQGYDRSCFPQPPSEPDVRFSLIRLSTRPSFPLLSLRALALASARSPFSLGVSEPRRAISGGSVAGAWSGCQAFPRPEFCCL